MEDRIEFTKEMKKTYKIIFPNMAPIHFNLFQKVFEHAGYDVEVLTNKGPSVVTEGLKYVHNDTCYPALLVIGQMIDALNSGKYDVHHTALLITQTGGGCRASNYIHLLRKALNKAGYGFVPVISLNMSGLEKNSGFKLTIPLLRRIVAGLIYGDLLMLLHNQCRPYENEKDASINLVNAWTDKLIDQFNHGKGYKSKQVKKNLYEIVNDFAKLPKTIVPKVKVGIVGEIYVKYSSLGNNDLEEFLFEQGCEINVPGILGFALFKVDNRIDDIDLYGGSFLKKKVCQILKGYLLKMESYMIDAVNTHPEFHTMTPYLHTKELVKNVIGYGNKMGEGWLLTAEMIELCESGFENIVCAQPLGLLPNHICGKGMIRKIKDVSKNANIVPIDYDPSATRVNQENRIKLMLSIAKEKLNEKSE